MTAVNESRLVRLTQLIGDNAKSHPMLVDASLAILVLAFATLDVAGDGIHPSQRTPDATAYLLLAGQTLPFMIRRKYPLVAMYGMVGSLSLYWLLDYPAGSDASGLIAIYSAVAYGRHRLTTWIHAIVAIVVMTAAASLLASSFFIEENGFSLLIVLAVVTLHSLAAGSGEVMHQRKKWLADLQERASRAEAAVETTARLAVAEERTRIAREMHDVVAHGISVISVQAAAGQEVVRSDPSRGAEIFANIEGTGREALAEMRRMLGVLRNGDHDHENLAPKPSLSDLDSAIAHCVDAGMNTELITTGDPRSLPPGIELAAYRIIQEALTNAVKHGGDATTAGVALHFGPEEIDIRVSDTGRGAVSSLTSTGSGNGLLGMRERVDAYGGEFSAGPQPGGGYEVRAQLPINRAADQSYLWSPQILEQQEAT